MDQHPGGAAEGASVDEWSYRAHLDGLRAIAVYLVVGFHAGVGRLSGGFVGVDVFFVLSGYLVTNVLLVDIRENGGRVRLARFYARRVRRLLPAATLVLLAAAASYPYLASDVEVHEAVDGVRAAALYHANWHFLWEANEYFGPASDASPVAHFWSLAVEEQFYLAWPVILLGLHRATRRLHHRDTVVRLVIGILAAASAAWAIHLAATSIDRAYFGTDARAYQLLVGSLLALSPQVVERLRGLIGPLFSQIVALFSLVALVTLASDVIDLTAIERGLAVTLVSLSLLVGMEAYRSGPLVKVLSTPLLVHLGRISYGTYLWHWLIVIFLQRQTAFSAPLVAVTVALVASGLAALSYAVVEMPMREARPLSALPVPVIGAGLAASFLVGVVVAPQLLDGSRRPAAVPATGAGVAIGVPVATPVDQDAVAQAYFDRREETRCVDRPVEDCISVPGAGPRVLLLGDSHAHMLVPAMEKLAREHDFELIDASKQGCPWQLDYYVLNDEIQAQCRSVRPDTYGRVIPELDPDIIVAINAQRPRPAFGARNGDENLRESTLRSLETLAEPGRRIVLLEGIPRHLEAVDLRRCLETAAVAETCRYEVGLEVHWLEALYREQARTRADVWSVDLDRLICPLYPTCDSMVGGQVVWRTEGHITGEYAETIAPRLWIELLATGAFER